MLDDGPCQPDITDRGYPTRTALVLRREENLFRAEVEELLNADDVLAVDGEPITDSEPTDDNEAITDSEPPPDDDELSMHQLDAVLASGDATRQPQAAFVAGRCAYPDQAARDRRADQLRAILAGGDPSDLGSRVLAHVEAAMSLALLGDDEGGRRALRAVASETGASMGAWLAAAYLAELGDPSAWPALVNMLGDRSGFTRLMAARHAAMWLPYSGQQVGGDTVDVRARLLERADDADSLVADEIPGLLAEIGGPDLGADLQRLAKYARHKSTRSAAKAVIERVGT